MAQQNIDFGSFPDDPSADAIRTAFSKVQNNFNQLFGANANSAVTSINRTPGAGITVNYPTGNVILSANIACLQVATTTLKVGRGSDNTQSNVTITSSSQALNIDIDPAQVLSNYFTGVNDSLTSLNGILTANAANQANITRVGTLSNLSVSGNVNFTGPNVYISNISNLKLPGGTVGYFLQTDGAGNLEWAAGGGGGNGSPGGINTYVQFNDTGAFGGNAGFTFNKVSGVLSSPLFTGTLTTNAQPNITSVGTLTTLNSSGNVTASRLISNVATGTAPFTVTSTTQVANLAAATAGSATTAGTVTTAAQPNITSVGSLTSLTLAANGDITLSGAGSNVQGANIVSASFLAGTLTTAAQPNITSVGSLTSVTVTGNANVSNLNASGNAIITGNLSVLGNITSINVENLNVEDPIISLGGGANGNALTTNDGKDRGTALQYYTTTPVTAFMGWDNGNAEFAMGANVSISAGEIVTYNTLGNVRVATVLGNIDGSSANFANANLGNTATANFFVGTFYGVANSSTRAGTVTTNAQPNITSVGTLSSLAVTGNVTAGNIVGTLANGNSNIRIAADSSVAISSTGNANILVVTGTGANIAGTGNFTGNVTVGNLYGPLANGNSNVRIAASNGNVTLTAVGNTTVTVTGTGVNVSGTLNTGTGIITGNGSGLTSITGANVTGTVANATYAVSAGTVGTVTTAAQPNITSVGTLSSLTVTANTTTGGIKTDNYYYANGVSISFAGAYSNSNVSAFLAVFGSNTISTTGNANLGNIGTGRIIATGNISATQLISNIATGTAPLTVTSTTRVANLNVAYANVSDFININTVSTGTQYLVLANAVTGNVAEGANSIYSVNVANGSLTATTFVGALSGAATSASTAATVTTNAQPNITSVGTLSSLTVTANTTTGGIKTDNYYYANGVSISFAGAYSNSNVSAFLAAFGSNTISTTGNANIGNIGAGRIIATGNISATQLISNIATGTAPFVVTSTTQVANLSVATAGSATTAGTVTTNAQPNITSVGTLSSLTSSGNISGANIVTTNYVIRSVSTSISAAGTVQANATALTKEINVVSTVASGSGVRLPTAVAGMVISITNTNANSLLVYPATSGIINSLAANAAFTQPAGATLQFIAPTTTQWYTVGATYA